MGKYITTAGQNIYDVALHLYGSIEGIVDLMINNPSLSLNDNLVSGDELMYSDNFIINADVVAYNRMNNITPSGSECRVYPKHFEGEKFCEIYLSNTLFSVEFSISGSGLLEINWGDNSPCEKIEITQQTQNITHRFDNKISQIRKISLYGVVRCKLLNITDLKAISLYISKHQYIEQFINQKSSLPIDFIPLLEGVYDIDFSLGAVSNLIPLISCKELMTLNLVDVKIKESVIDEYLITLVNEHDNRRNCNIIISAIPSGSYAEPSKDSNGKYILSSGMEAIWVLTHEEAWNEAGHWNFIINNVTYSYEQNN